jgi:hypothetical protein
MKLKYFKNIMIRSKNGAIIGRDTLLRMQHAGLHQQNGYLFKSLSPLAWERDLG